MARCVAASQVRYHFASRATPLKRRSVGRRTMSDDDVQRTICARFGATFLESRPESNLGIALTTLGQLPINGLRHQPEDGTCGWFVWAGGTFSDNSELFQPMHVSHLSEHCPDVLPYLGLEPGWRFLIAPGYEDVWFDESLLRA